VGARKSGKFGEWGAPQVAYLIEVGAPKTLGRLVSGEGPKLLT
jgi:hypothetical protein